MNVGRICRTVARLRPSQIVWQVLIRAYKPQLKAVEAPVTVFDVHTESVAKPVSMFPAGEFEFLNIRDEFRGWNNCEHGMLWAYNQNYMDWLNQPGLSATEGARWIDRFIADIPSNRVGLDPYPTALRVINWLKFFCRFRAEATKARLDSLYSQVLLLERRLERHLLGNHLLEDAYALFIAANVFRDERLLRRSTSLLLHELREKISHSLQVEFEYVDAIPRTKAGKFKAIISHLTGLHHSS